MANVGNKTIVKFDSSGYGSVWANSGLVDPYGLAFDGNGNLFVANNGNNTIEKFDSTGHGSLFADANAGLSWPMGLAFDDSGNLYVANTHFYPGVGGDGYIEKFDSSGNGTVFATGGMKWFGFMTIQVPEPGTWALVALGAATLFGSRRLRRRSL